jgi:lauroyl/myristoyl acyltransferase
VNLRELLAADGVFWRRLADTGANHTPEWFRRATPPLFALGAILAIPEARARIRSNLIRVRGPASAVRDAIDVVRTFSTFAYSITDALSTKPVSSPSAIIYGERVLADVRRAGRGAIFATAHTAGWEMVGPLLSRDHAMRVVMVMAKERDDKALELQDAARAARGATVVHVGADDPLASLDLLRHARRGGVVALQVDRAPPGVRTRAVELFGAPGVVPEGPIRLAQLSGAPLVPVFAARLGHQRYLVRAYDAIVVRRRATEAEIDAAAQALADAMTAFIRAHPTQWLHFGD